MDSFSIDLDWAKLIKPVSITTHLSKKYGGRWHYNRRMGSWFCDDQKRHVSRVSMCSCDEPCHHASEYFMYYTQDPPTRHELLCDPEWGIPKRVDWS